MCIENIRSHALSVLTNAITELINSGKLDDMCVQLYNDSMNDALSDIRRKRIKMHMSNNEPLPPDLMYSLLNAAGPDSNGTTFNKYCSSDDDSICNAYADHIKNYLYTYKDDATEIDPSIDPTEEQIGPMAQDIEKVNPASVKELSDGTKVVDTKKLSLMNAGAIADLARDIKSIKEAING